MVRKYYKVLELEKDKEKYNELVLKVKSFKGKSEEYLNKVQRTFDENHFSEIVRNKYYSHFGSVREIPSFDRLSNDIMIFSEVINAYNTDYSNIRKTLTNKREQQQNLIIRLTQYIDRINNPLDLFGQPDFGSWSKVSKHYNLLLAIQKGDSNAATALLEDKIKQWQKEHGGVYPNAKEISEMIENDENLRGFVNHEENEICPYPPNATDQEKIDALKSYLIKLGYYPKDLIFIDNPNTPKNEELSALIRMRAGIVKSKLIAAVVTAKATGQDASYLYENAKYRPKAGVEMDGLVGKPKFYCAYLQNGERVEIREDLDKVDKKEFEKACKNRKAGFFSIELAEKKKFYYLRGQNIDVQTFVPPTPQTDELPGTDQFDPPNEIDADTAKRVERDLEQEKNQAERNFQNAVKKFLIGAAGPLGDLYSLIDSGLSVTTIDSAKTVYEDMRKYGVKLDELPEGTGAMSYVTNMAQNLKELSNAYSQKEHINQKYENQKAINDESKKGENIVVGPGGNVIFAN